MIAHANDVFDAIKQHQRILPLGPNDTLVCITSHDARDAFIRRCQSEGVGFDAVKVIASPLFKTDHAFFFKNEKDATDMLDTIHDTVKLGVSWSEVLEVLISGVKRKMGH